MPKVNLSRLPADRRQASWAWLRREHDDIADWLQQPDIVALRQVFDGEVIVEWEAPMPHPKATDKR